MIKRNFATLNRISQAVVARLLRMRDPDNELNLKLVNQLFGKLALDKFLQFGAFPNFKKEKQTLLKFILAHLRIVDKVNCARPAQNATRSAAESVAKANWENDYKINALKGEIPFEAKNKISEKVLFSGGNFWGQNKNARKGHLQRRGFDWETVEEIRARGAAEKYVGHLLWLRETFGYRSERFRSFESLLLEAFAANESRTRADRLQALGPSGG